MMPTSAHESSYFELSPFMDALNEFRDIYGDMTISQAIFLTSVAVTPGQTQIELMKRTGLADSSISRIFSIMSHRGNRGTGPFNLVMTKDDPTDYRIKRIYLTPQGNAVFRHIVQHLEKITGSRETKE